MAVQIEVTRENPEPSVLALVNPTCKKGKPKMPRETNADKIARLEAELDEANSRIEELEDERQGALSLFAENYGVEIFDPETESEFDEEGEIEEGEEESEV